MTPSVAAPGDSNLSDATVGSLRCLVVRTLTLCVGRDEGHSTKLIIVSFRPKITMPRVVGLLVTGRRGTANSAVAVFCLFFQLIYFYRRRSSLDK